jgi:hypothetical protein
MPPFRSRCAQAPEQALPCTGSSKPAATLEPLTTGAAERPEGEDFAEFLRAYRLSLRKVAPREGARAAAAAATSPSASCYAAAAVKQRVQRFEVMARCAV